MRYVIWCSNVNLSYILFLEEVIFSITRFCNKIKNIVLKKALKNACLSRISDHINVFLEYELCNHLNNLWLQWH